MFLIRTIALAVTTLTSFAANAAAADAQNADAYGRVIDAAGMPVTGIVVTAAGNDAMAITDFDGRFTITGAANATLTFTRDRTIVATVTRAESGIVVRLATTLRTIGQIAVANRSTGDAGQVTTTDDTSLSRDT